MLKQLVRCKLSDFESMREHVNFLVMTSPKVQIAGLNIDEELTASLMLARLPDDFRALVLAVENSKEKLTIDSIKTLLLQDVKLDSKCSENALYLKDKMKPKQLRCHSCNQLAHFARQCPNKFKKECNNTKKNKKYSSHLSSRMIFVKWTGLLIQVQHRT